MIWYRFRHVGLFVAFLVLILLVGCGGGGMTNGPQPAPSPTPVPGDFTLNVSVGSLTAAPGSHAGTIQASTVASGGFQSPVTISATAPGGVNCLPACSQSFPVPALATFNFNVGNSVAVGNYTITIAASGGGHSHSADIPLTVQPAPAIIANRSSFVRTDDSPSDIVFDALRHLVYTANRRLNRIEVISPVTGAILQTISVPKPVGMDITVDNNSLYVGAEVQQLYRIDLNSMQVAERIQYVPVPPLQAPYTDQPVTLASGKVLVRTSCGRLSPCITENDLVEYDPATHSFTSLNPPNIFISVGALARSADHTKVLVATSDSGGHFDLFDSASDTFIAQDSGFLFGNVIGSISGNSDGTQFAMVAACCQLVVVDGNLQQLFSRSNNAVFMGLGTRYSQDGTRLYVPQDPSDTHNPIIDVLDTSTFADLGQIPDLKLDGHPIRPLIHSLTDDGMLLSSAERGLGLIDANVPPSQLPSIAPLPGFEFMGSLLPSHVASGDRTTTMGGVGFEFTPQVFFGSQPASSVSFVSDAQLDLAAPAPVSSGPVNVKAVFPGGFFTIAPDGYTYGPQALYVTPNSGPTAGGDETTVLGYGLNYNPAQITVTAGGQPGTVLSTSSTLGRSPFSFPVQSVSFMPPPAGAPSDSSISLSTPDGTTTIPYHYFAKTTFPVTGTSQMVVDDVRNRVYASNSVNNSIDVISLNTGSVSSIPLGVSPVGIAMTPDGTRLLTANFDSKTVSIVDPDNPVNPTSVNVDTGDTVVIPQPLTVAGLAGGKAFVGMDSVNVIGCVGVLREIDLATLVVTTRTPPTAPCVSNDFLMVASGDGTRAYVGSMLWEQATDSFSFFPLDVVPGSSLRAASLTGNFFTSADSELSGLIFDSKLRVSYKANSPDLLECLLCVADGMKLHSSGSLLYVALSRPLSTTPDKLDIFDTRTGALLRRIDVPEKWGVALDVLGVDKSGTRIFGITQSGIVEFQLAAAPLSLGDITPASGTIGASLTFSGSGFSPGMTVSIGGQPATVTFMDPDTANVIVPGLAPGVYDTRITNPNGETYSVDAAFTVN